MLAVQQVVPFRIGGEVRVLTDVGDEFAGGAVVETDAATGSLATTDGELPPFISIHPVFTGFGDVTRDSRAGRRANERDAFCPLREGEKIGGRQQMIQKDLQAPVEQGRTGHVALLSTRRPQPLIHLDVDKKSSLRIQANAPDGPEEGTVLEGLAQNRFQAFVKILVVSQIRASKTAGIHIAQPDRHTRRHLAAHPPHLAAAVQLALRLDVVRPGRDGEGEFVRCIGHRMQGRLQADRRLGDGTRLKKFEHVEMNRNAFEGLQDQLDVSGPGHDRRVMHAVVRQPGKVLFGKPRLEEHMVTRYLMPDQRAIRVLALPDEKLVVTHDIHRHLLFFRMTGQQVDNRLRSRILGGEVQVHTGPEQGA